MSGQIEIKASYPVKEKRNVLITYGQAKVEFIVDVDTSLQSLEKMRDMIFAFANAKEYLENLKSEVENDPKYQKQVMLKVD